MPTNQHAQVKMTPQTKAAHTHRDAVALAPKLDSESTHRRSHGMTARGPQSVLGNTALEAANTSTLIVIPESKALSFGYALGKRVFDLVLGVPLLLIAIPIVVIAAVVIRINTPGSPFFFQTRLGKNGKPFKLFKLRGMYIDARKRFPTYYDYSQKRDLEFCFHHEEDPRVTKAGKFIRRTSIDELPNLWNVVVGNVSLVGPRPEIPEVMALYGAYREHYLSVKPGITCLSKVTGRDRLTKRETIEFDLDYIRRRSFVLDFKILWQTFRGVVLRRDVF